MKGEPIDEVNKGLNIFANELAVDTLASKRVDVGIVTFGDGVSVECSFEAARDFRPPQLKASGLTPMGEAIVTGLDMITARKEAYRKNGIIPYRPWVFLITDGGPTDSDSEYWVSAINRVQAGEQRGSFSFFAVGVQGSSFDQLREVSVREPLQLKGLMFRELFSWLSASMQNVSGSNPGDVVKGLAPSNWADQAN
jgi:uncharacterized protein YegL